MDDRVALLRANNKHIDTRAYVAADLGEIVLELVVRHVPRDQQSYSITLRVLRTLDHMRTHPDRFEIVLRFFYNSYTAVGGSLFYICLIHEEGDLGATAVRQLQLHPDSQRDEVEVILQPYIVFKRHVLPVVVNVAPLFRISVSEC